MLLLEPVLSPAHFLGKGNYMFRMNRILIALTVIATFSVIFVGIASARSAGSKPDPKLVLITKCGTSSDRPNKTYTGKSTFIRVLKNGCASVDKGATALAYDYSVVAAHGSSAVIGYGHATLIIYNADVTCAYHGLNVNVIYAYKSGFTLCKKLY